MAVRRRHGTAREFILRHDDLEAEELARLGAAHGFEISPKLVRAVRYFSPPAAPRAPRPTTPQCEPAPRSQRRVSAKAERRFAELAQEIGFERALELLDLVEQLLRESEEAGGAG